jgi:hypothetical protein
MKNIPIEVRNRRIDEFLKNKKGVSKSETPFL